MHYAHYGDFMETNEAGEVLGTFQAADMALLMGYSRQLNKRFSVARLKVIYSDYYLYNSFGWRPISAAPIMILPTRLRFPLWEGTSARSSTVIRTEIQNLCLLRFRRQFPSAWHTFRFVST
jgi:hypothetical protein